MQKSAHSIIAIDISKETLEVLSEKRSFSVSNAKDGLSKLLKHIATIDNPITVFEATGGYERALMEALANKAMPFARLNPARIRYFAKSEGVKAKTDPIDTRMILRFAQEKDIRADSQANPTRQKIADLLDRRNHLTATLAQEKNRLQNSSKTIHASIKRLSKILEKEITAIAKQIRKLVKSDAKLNEQVNIAQSVIGVGEITAWTILCCLVEIETLSRNKIVALTGIAPFNNDSGKSKKKRRIQEGRAKVRKCLYMATKTAANHNPVIKEYVDALRARGKPYKCAIVAGMRKLLLHLQSLLKKHNLALAS
ncbi:MAG: IS110 family transposase [Opitutales bacterium]|jgi:transposase|nr:IS110 family transposase [Opitutales bacterium]